MKQLVIVILFLVFFGMSCARSTESPLGTDDSFSACTSPATLSAAYLDLPNARPCWSWIDAQAAVLPRQAMPAVWKGIGWDPISVAPPGSDNTAALKTKGDTLAASWGVDLNFSPYALISAPWADSTGTSYEFPYSTAVLDEKLRGMATVALYARSLGYRVQFTMPTDNSWLSSHQLASQADFISWIDNQYVPQLREAARAAERIHAEAMNQGVTEIEQFFNGQTGLKALGTAAVQQMADYWLTQATTAMTAGGFTGRRVVRLVSNELHYTLLDWPNWSAAAMADYDELGITITAVTPACIGYEDTLDAIVGRVNVMIGKVATAGKMWSVAEVLAPYSGSAQCSEVNENAIYTALVNRLQKTTAGPHDVYFSRDPVGVLFDLNPVPLPLVSLFPSTQAILRGYL